MIKDLKVNKDTRIVSKSKFDKIGLGVQNDNEADVLRFSFDQEFLGQATLLTDIKDINNENIGIPMNYNEKDKTYDLVLTKEMLTNENITFQLQVVNESMVWNSRKATLPIFRSLKVGEGTLPSTIELWLTNANKELYKIIESEKRRESAESNRNSNEEIRKTNESERISNEDVRKANEITRKENEVNREKYISDLKQDVADGKFDGEDYILTEQDEDNIADKVKIKLEPSLEANLKTSKDYTDNANIFDIKNVEYSQENAVITFTRHDDTKIIIDLPIEMTLKNGYYDSSTKELVLVLMNDQEIRIPASGLIDDYSTQDSTTIQLSISADNVITASIKGQSISKTHLTQELQDEINNKVNNDNYASSDKSGVIKVPDWSGLVVNSSGNLYPDVYTLERYKQRGINLALSKGTIENIKNAYVKEAIQSDEVKEELHNQGFVKDDDLKPLKKNIDDNTDRIKRIEYDIFESGEAEGTSIHIEDSTYAEAIEIGNEGVSNQETTKGNQLFDIKDGIYLGNNNDLSIEFKDGVGKITILNEDFEACGVPVDLNETILAKGTYTETNNCGIYPYITLKYNNDIIVSAMTNTDNGIKTFTLEENVTVNKIVLFFRHFSFGENIVPSEIRPQLVQGEYTSETMPTFEKFTYGASPNLNYPQDIEVMESGIYNIYTCGKNLLPMNSEYVPNYTITKNGITLKVNTDLSISLSGTATNKTEFFLLGKWGIKNNIFLPSTILILSQNGFVDGITSNLGFFNDGVNVFNKGLTNLITKQNINLSSINFDGISYAISISSGKTINTTIYNQLECGLVNTEFEPYIESKLEVTIPEGEFVSEGDRINVEWNEEDREYHIYLYKNIGRFILNGDEDWLKSSMSNSEFFVGAVNLNSQNVKAKFGTATIWKTTHFLYTNELQNEEGFNAYGGNANYDYFGISIRASKINDVNALKTWLLENNITVYYKLAEPYVLDLGITDMPKTFTDITNVFSDHPLQPNLHIKNYRDFKKTIKGLQAKVQTLEETSVKNTDYATLNKAGLLRTSYSYCTNTDPNGYLIIGIRNLNAYQSLSDNAAVSKGTLEAVLKPIRDKLEELSPSINQESEVNNDDLLQG